LIFCLLFDKIIKVDGYGGENMANIKSAKKRILVNETKHSNNVPKKSVMKTTIKKALVNPSEETVNEANKRIDKALKSGIITKNKAARQKSRIAKKLNNNK
jgi:small subunit ribosomal protein S20